MTHNDEDSGEGLPALLPMSLERFAVDAASPFPIYEQICQCVRVAIASGELPGGAVLPTARALAARLKVGRNTVVVAYGRLAAEGHVTSNTRRGTRVAENPAPFALGTLDEERHQLTGAAQTLPTTKLSVRARHLFSENGERPLSGIRALRSPDPSLYPRAALGRLLAEEFAKPVFDETPDVERFQSALSILLRQMRGIRCAPQQIIPVVSTAHAFDLIVRLLIDRGDTVYVEDPFDPILRECLQTGGAQLAYIPCDAQGADITKVNGPRPRLVVISPSANFPFGRQMSESRREAILQFAQSHGAAILEWDRCWGLSYTGRRTGALQTQAPEGTLVYVDSFFETLGVHVQLGYIVVPDFLAQPLTSMIEQRGSWPAAFVLAAIARFVESHQFNVHLSEVRKVYARRLRRLADLCRISLDDAVVVEPNAGYTMAIEFPNGPDDTEVCRLAGDSLAIMPLSRLYRGASGTERAGLAIGAGALTERMIDVVARQIAKATREARTGRYEPEAYPLARLADALSSHH
ncbi:MAG TPA: PLP-dependent aminotransferase family protein [Rhizomicrobium sp.]|jgi:GntR family transcriptional regulator/MocR family aminotransferase